MIIETIQTGEYITDYGKEIGRLIALIGKGGGGKYHVLDATITTLLQRHDY